MNQWRHFHNTLLGFNKRKIGGQHKKRFFSSWNVNPIYVEHLSEGQLVDEAQGCQPVDTGKRIVILDLADTPRCNEVVHNLRFLSEALALFLYILERQPMLFSDLPQTLACLIDSVVHWVFHSFPYIRMDGPAAVEA